MHTKDKGTIAEACVISDLAKQGHKVALPFGENLPFDLIAIRPDHSLLRLQVSTYGYSMSIPLLSEVPC